MQVIPKVICCMAILENTNLIPARHITGYDNEKFSLGMSNDSLTHVISEFMVDKIKSWSRHTENSPAARAFDALNSNNIPACLAQESKPETIVYVYFLNCTLWTLTLGLADKPMSITRFAVDVTPAACTRVHNYASLSAIMTVRLTNLPICITNWIAIWPRVTYGKSQVTFIQKQENTLSMTDKKAWVFACCFAEIRQVSSYRSCFKKWMN